MAALIGFLIGGFVACFLVYSLLHWALFKRVMSDRFLSHITAAAVTYPVSAVLSGFGAADGGDFKFTGFVSYLLPSIVILIIAFKVGRDQQRKVTDQLHEAVFQ